MPPSPPRPRRTVACHAAPSRVAQYRAGPCCPVPARAAPCRLLLRRIQEVQYSPSLHPCAPRPVSRYPNNTDFDLTGSLTYISLTIYSFVANSAWKSIRSIVLCSMVLVWAMRLGSFLYVVNPSISSPVAAPSPSYLPSTSGHRDRLGPRLRPRFRLPHGHHHIIATAVAAAAKSSCVCSLLPPPYCRNSPRVRSATTC